MGAKYKILFVDDDAELVAALKRAVRRKYVVDVAVGPIRALEAVTERGPYAAVVADLRMPGLDGMDFFVRLRRVCPDTARIMLTGYADLPTAMEAINAAGVFRFLSKPCAEDALEEALAAGVAQYQQATAEKEFLKAALRGIIKVLTDLLALQNPEAMGRANRVRRLVMDMARSLEAPEQWRIELAVTLSQLGALVMPEAMFAALRTEGDLAGDRAELFRRHPAIGADLLASIPRLDEVADIIRHQERPFSGEGEGPSGPDIPLGSRLLKAALDYDRLLTAGAGREAALEAMRAREGVYDPEVFELLRVMAGSREGYAPLETPLSCLTAGMILEEDIRLVTGEKAAAAGQMVDAGLLARLRELGPCRPETLRVLAPAGEEPACGLVDPELLALLRRVRNASPLG
ncbi:MAG: HD domain-containing phosphohydrolase [Solidesulfovibrio sp. DCME]|uniref:HD domain-containing phosphohydrolase n=1 Tax=Solidesulfovibrio sp. DCME TaxID=3447380 RepID=UPI003D12C00E